MKRFRLRLRWRLFLVALLAAVPLLALFLFKALEFRHADAETAQQGAQRLARSLAREHEATVRASRQLLVSLSHVPEVVSGDGRACAQIMAAILAERPMYANLAVARPDGEVYCSARPAAGRVNVRDQPDFARALSTRRFAAGDYIVGKIVGRPILSTVLPVLDRQGEVLVLLYGGLDLGWMGEQVDAARLPEGTMVTLFDPGGRVLVRHPSPEGWVGNEGRVLPEIETVLARRDIQTFEGQGRDRVKRLFAVADVRSDGRLTAFMTVGIPLDVAYERGNLLLRGGLAALALVAALAAILAFAGSEALVLRPVHALAEAARRVADGDFAARTGFAGRGDELGEMSRAFDAMAGALEQRQREAAEARNKLGESEEKLQFAMQSAGVFGWEWEIASDKLRWAIDPAPLLGPSGPAGYPDFRTLIHPEDRERFLAAGRRSINESAPYGCEFRIIRTDGKVRWLKARGRLVPADGGTARLVGVSWDITERKATEIALRESELRLSTLVDSLPGIAVQGYDRQRRVIYWNPASERLFGYSRHEAMRRRLEDLTVPPALRERALRDFEALVEGGEAIAPAPLMLKRRDGAPVAVYSGYVMQHNGRGEPEVFRIDVDLTRLEGAAAGDPAA